MAGEYFSQTDRQQAIVLSKSYLILASPSSILAGIWAKCIGNPMLHAGARLSLRATKRPQNAVALASLHCS